MADVLSLQDIVLTDEHLLDASDCDQAALRYEERRRLDDYSHALDVITYRGPPKGVVATSTKRSVANVAIAQDVLEHTFQRAVDVLRLATIRARSSNSSLHRWGGNASFLADARTIDPMCPAPKDDVLRDFLESIVSYTPQHANLTRVVRAAARHVYAMSLCQVSLWRSLSRFWECTGTAWNVITDGTLAIVGWENSLRELDIAIQVDVHAPRPEAWKIAESIASVSTAAVSALSRHPVAELVISGLRVYENRTDSSVSQRWLDTLCCGFVRPDPVVVAEFDGCTPAHHTG